MPAAKFRPVGPQDDHPAPRSIYSQPVLAHALYHGYGPGVAHAEAFPGPAPNEGAAAGGPIEGHVAYDNVLTFAAAQFWRAHGDAAS